MINNRHNHINTKHNEEITDDEGMLFQWQGDGRRSMIIVVTISVVIIIIMISSSSSSSSSSSNLVVA